MINEKCPKCDNGLLLPTFDNKIIVNKCPACGYTKPKDNSDIQIGGYGSYEWLMKVFLETRKSLLEDGDRIIVISYLKSIRENRTVSQKQMAEILRFTEQRYGNVERHYNAPSVILSSMFAYLLDVPLGDLYKAVKVKKEMYEEMKYLKIVNGEIVPFEELKKAYKRLNAISDKNSTEYNLVQKECDELIKNNSTSLLLKQGELIENIYWEKYIEMKGMKSDVKPI